MNERIRELAIEAKLMVSTYTGELTKSEQKFAELIIRECIDTASNAKSLEAAAMIKQRFRS